MDKNWSGVVKGRKKKRRVQVGVQRQKAMVDKGWCGVVEGCQRKFEVEVQAKGKG